VDRAKSEGVAVPLMPMEVSRMEHARRLALAGEITQVLLRRHGDDILAVAVWGSVARGADTAHSDLELWAVTTAALPPREALRVAGDVVVQVSRTTADRALADAGTVDRFWPINAAKWREYRALVDRSGFCARLRAATTGLRDEAFDRALRDAMRPLPEVAGKLHSSRERGDRYGLLKAGRDLTHNTALIIGLANRRHYPSTREYYPLSLAMPRQPSRYRALLDEAGGFATAEPARVYAAATALWDDLRRFVRELGIAWDDDTLDF
jgi:kanamycin nucleotidyltransferase